MVYTLLLEQTDTAQLAKMLIQDLFICVVVFINKTHLNHHFCEVKGAIWTLNKTATNVKHDIL